MTREDEHLRPEYNLCLCLLILFIFGLFMLPLSYLGLSELPSLIIMAGLFLVPLLACNIGVEGYPLFKWHFHGSRTEMEYEQTTSGVEQTSQ